ncbi:MAG: beta-ketoacyl synthase N-terminal-like domain-containing protein [Bacteroidota bacterium]
MRDVFVVSDNIVSPVGYTSAENFRALTNDVSGIREQLQPSIWPFPFYASLLTDDRFTENTAALASAGYTKFEQLVILSVSNTLQQSGIDVQSPETILVISSTKGNISLLETAEKDAPIKDLVGLHTSAKKIAAYFKLSNIPVVISNACISGLTALLTGKRLLETGFYKNAVVVGADVISSFILSGFQSFQAISPQPCRPFDAARNGINLGEAAATVVLSTRQGKSRVKLAGGAITNDANHISGPSRTGQELCMAINKALQQAGISAADLGFISAHGTATVYNDEMEAKAFSLAGLETVPLNSLKGYYGHTLGASGIVEAVISIHSLQEGKMVATRGFRHSGVSKPITVCKEVTALETSHCLKTASGFGGCNAALVFSKALN